MQPLAPYQTLDNSLYERPGRKGPKVALVVILIVVICAIAMAAFLFWGRTSIHSFTVHPQLTAAISPTLENSSLLLDVTVTSSGNDTDINVHVNGLSRDEVLRIARRFAG